MPWAPQEGPGEPAAVLPRNPERPEQHRGGCAQPALQRGSLTGGRTGVPSCGSQNIGSSVGACLGSPPLRCVCVLLLPHRSLALPVTPGCKRGRQVGSTAPSCFRGKAPHSRKLHTAGQNRLRGPRRMPVNAQLDTCV